MTALEHSRGDDSRPVAPSQNRTAEALRPLRGGKPTAQAALCITEKQFSQQVFDLARLRGWLVARFPAWQRTGTTPGFPDLVLVRGGRLIFAELKVGKRVLSPAQEDWYDALMGIKGIDFWIWRPNDWNRIEEVLR